VEKFSQAARIFSWNVIDWAGPINTALEYYSVPKPNLQRAGININLGKLAFTNIFDKIKRCVKL